MQTENRNDGFALQASLSAQCVQSQYVLMRKMFMLGWIDR